MVITIRQSLQNTMHGQLLVWAVEAPQSVSYYPSLAVASFQARRLLSKHGGGRIVVQ